MMNLFCQSLLLTMQLAFGQEATYSQVTTNANIGKMYACPRCRRAEPRGPRKRPTPPIRREK